MIWLIFRARGIAEGEGGELTPVFGRPVIPIQIRGADSDPYITASSPPPDSKSYLHLWRAEKLLKIRISPSLVSGSIENFGRRYEKSQDAFLISAQWWKSYFILDAQSAIQTLNLVFTHCEEQRSFECGRKRYKTLY